MSQVGGGGGEEGEQKKTKSKSVLSFIRNFLSENLFYMRR
jgi:hypothetical protein